MNFDLALGLRPVEGSKIPARSGTTYLTVESVIDGLHHPNPCWIARGTLADGSRAHVWVFVPQDGC